MKRAFDIIAALLGLVLLLPVAVVIAGLIKLDSTGSILFKQERIGRRFRPFFIYKFRTMVQDAPQRGGPITFGGDLRITRIGRFLRKVKMDELPQLWNVLRGEMTLVGPRPEVRQYVELFHKDYQEILRVRPGITDLASLKYRDESTLLGLSSDPENEYLTRLLPDKIMLAKEYIRCSSFWFDLQLILKTLEKLVCSQHRVGKS